MAMLATNGMQMSTTTANCLNGPSLYSACPSAFSHYSNATVCAAGAVLLSPGPPTNRGLPYGLPSPRSTYSSTPTAVSSSQATTSANECSDDADGSPTQRFSTSGFSTVRGVRENGEERLFPADKSKTIAPPIEELVGGHQFKGHVLAIAKDQAGCRMLQKKLDEGASEDVQTISSEVFTHIVELMVDPFGNYLCQKLMEVSPSASLSRIIEQCTPHLVEVSLNMHGTRAVQKLIEVVQTPDQIQAVIRALASAVVTLVKDLNGNHVVQKCLNCLSCSQCDFIYDAIAGHCVEVATHRHGCCVLQRCIDAANARQKALMISEIGLHSLTLVQDAFGNYVVQYILNLQDANITSTVVHRLAGNIAELSKQKFSSNVIEKCLTLCNTNSRRMIIRELLNGTRQLLRDLLVDSFANYVVQRALNVSEEPEFTALLDAIRPHLDDLRSTAAGKRIATKLIKKYPGLLSPSVNHPLHTACANSSHGYGGIASAQEAKGTSAMAPPPPPPPQNVPSYSSRHTATSTSFPSQCAAPPVIAPTMSYAPAALPLPPSSASAASLYINLESRVSSPLAGCRAHAAPPLGAGASLAGQEVMYSFRRQTVASSDPRSFHGFPLPSAAPQAQQCEAGQARRTGLVSGTQSCVYAYWSPSPANKNSCASPRYSNNALKRITITDPFKKDDSAVGASAEASHPLFHPTAGVTALPTTTARGSCQLGPYYSTAAVCSPPHPTTLHAHPYTGATGRLAATQDGQDGKPVHLHGVLCRSQSYMENARRPSPHANVHVRDLSRVSNSVTDERANGGQTSRSAEVYIDSSVCCVDMPGVRAVCESRGEDASKGGMLRASTTVNCRPAPDGGLDRRLFCIQNVRTEGVRHSSARHGKEAPAPHQPGCFTHDPITFLDDQSYRDQFDSRQLRLRYTGLFAEPQVSGAEHFGADSLPYIPPRQQLRTSEGSPSSAGCSGPTVTLAAAASAAFPSCFAPSCCFIPDSLDLHSSTTAQPQSSVGSSSCSTHSLPQLPCIEAQGTAEAVSSTTVSVFSRDCQELLPTLCTELVPGFECSPRSDRRDEQQAKILPAAPHPGTTVPESCRSTLGSFDIWGGSPVLANFHSTSSEGAAAAKEVNVNSEAEVTTLLADLKGGASSRRQQQDDTESDGGSTAGLSPLEVGKLSPGSLSSACSVPSLSKSPPSLFPYSSSSSLWLDCDSATTHTPCSYQSPTPDSISDNAGVNTADWMMHRMMALIQTEEEDGAEAPREGADLKCGMCPQSDSSSAGGEEEEAEEEENATSRVGAGEASHQLQESVNPSGRPKPLLPSSSLPLSSEKASLSVLPSIGSLTSGRNSVWDGAIPPNMSFFSVGGDHRSGH